MFLEISLCFYVCGLDSLDLKYRYKTKHGKICHSKVLLSGIRKTDEKEPDVLGDTEVLLADTEARWGLWLWDQAKDTLSNVNVTEAEAAHFRVCEGTREKKSMNKAPACVWIT